MGKGPLCRRHNSVTGDPQAAEPGKLSASNGCRSISRHVLPHAARLLQPHRDRPFVQHVSHTNKYPNLKIKHATKMNLLLSDDYLLQDYPENITNTIRSGHATCLRFNRKGDFLASGRVDGTVVIWDLDTMGVARKLRGHSKSISSLSWSRCGRYLLSACQGWKAILWDLQDGKRHREVRFKAPVYIAELHPWNQ